eukprot:7417326-Ditylum_brightwellii.AAC.1
MQKKYIRNIRKPLVLGSHKWISRMIKLNDYLVHFPVPDGVTVTKIACEEFINVLEDGVLYQWKLDFKKEGFDSSSSTLKEFLDMCVRLEEAELQKPLKKKLARAVKEHDKLDDRKSMLWETYFASAKKTPWGKQQRLRQVWFMKDAKRHTKRHGLTGKE